MLTPVLLAFVSSSSPSLALPERPRPVPPAVEVWLSARRTFRWGVRARVNTQTSADGYLVVLYADAAGRVRILFPLSPTGDQFVRGGQTYELGGSGAAALDDTTGHGIVLAVVASEPFAVERYVRQGQWDFKTLGDSARARPSASLLDLARSMLVGDRLRYDLASYAVASKRHKKPDPRQYAERGHQPDPEQGGQRVAQPGKIFYPLAYGYSSGGRYSSMGGLNSRMVIGALMSFPYRYDQFHRGPRKIWW